MKSAIFKTFMLGACLMVASCASSRHYASTSIDANAKTIAMDTEESGVISDLKYELRQRGWSIYAPSHEVTDKVSDEKMVTYKGNARYYLRYNWWRIDTNLLTFEPILNFNASLIDNHSGMEVLSYEAKYTDQDDCAEEFAKLIEQNTK